MAEDPRDPYTRRLIERARAGERAAYEELFALHAERLQLFVRARLGARLRQRLDSLDVLQEAYAEAHRLFERFEDRGPGSFFRWLCRITENRIRGLADHHNAAKRRPDGGPAPLSDVLQKLGLSTHGPATRAERREARERLEAALESLGEEGRRVVLLRFFQGLTLDEVAQALDTSPTSARRMVGRALKDLGRALKTDGRSRS